MISTGMYVEDGFKVVLEDGEASAQSQKLSVYENIVCLYLATSATFVPSDVRSAKSISAVLRSGFHYISISEELMPMRVDIASEKSISDVVHLMEANTTVLRASMADKNASGLVLVCKFSHEKHESVDILEV